MKLLTRLLFLPLLVSAILFNASQAQTNEISWSKPFNISNSPDNNSTNPFLLSDPAGIAHLFWAEKAGETPGSSADTLMYTSWDGKVWKKPVDIFFSPVSDGNPILIYPAAVLDQTGTIHLIWLSEPYYPNYALNYSSVHSSQAGDPQAWRTRRELAVDLSGTFYSVAIAVDSSQILHVIYARVAQGDNPSSDRAVAYIRSEDGGATWSKPRDIWKTTDKQRGASNIKILADKDGSLFAAWTEWDLSGNGQAINFIASYDQGLTWQPPIQLTKRRGLEYNRDWNNLVIFNDGTISAVWEGGWRSYRYSMYSTDRGKTWSEPIDTFPWLIGENGFAHFVVDGAGVLRMFLSQRLREGTLNRQGDGGLWYSVWEGGTRWSEPRLACCILPMINPTIAIIRGNLIAAVWHSDTDFEVRGMVGKIDSAPSVPAQPWPDNIQNPTASAPNLAENLTDIPVTPTPISARDPGTEIVVSSETENNNQTLLLFAALLPSLILVVLIFWLRRNN